MLSRSSLETQKLELMSAMSELKLQQAALERDNLELRSTYIKNSLTNLNNNALFYNKRTPTGTNTRNGINGTSSPQHTNGTNGTLHGSHGNLPQSLSVTHKVKIYSIVVNFLSFNDDFYFTVFARVLSSKR